MFWRLCILPFFNLRSSKPQLLQKLESSRRYRPCTSANMGKITIMGVPTPHFGKAVVIGRVGWVSTFWGNNQYSWNSAARPADRLAATWPQLTELEIDGFKWFESDASLPLKHERVTRAHPDNWRWKKLFCTLCGMIGNTRFYAAAFGSITAYCNRTTSNPMATALLGG